MEKGGQDAEKGSIIKIMYRKPAGNLESRARKI
jgi:hypothetical protein